MLIPDLTIENHCNCKFYWIHKELSVTFVIVCCGVYICIECYENKMQSVTF